jgi:hypothetical protein
MKIPHYILSRFVMVTAACSLAASPLIQAQEAKLDSALASSGNDARLVVARGANFGILETVAVFVDGVQVAELEPSQNYDAVLPPGEHVLSISINPRTDRQRLTHRSVNSKPGQTYAFRAVWRNADYASLEP